MVKKDLIRGLIVSFMTLIILSIVSFVFDFYFKIFLSLFLINFALLFSFKINSLFSESQGKKEANGVRGSFPMNTFLKSSFKPLIVYGIPLLILLYILYLNFLPFGYRGLYTLNIGSEEDTDKSNIIFVEENDNVLGSREEDNSSTFRKIIYDKPIIIHFRSPIPISENIKAEIGFEIDGLYNDIFVNNLLIHKNLENYSLLKEFEDSYLYIQNDLNKKIPMVRENSAEGYISKNFESASIFSMSDIRIPNNYQKNYKKESNIINSAFRGSVNFLIYSEGDLELEYTKKDYNRYIGEDKYSISIYNSNNDLVYRKLSKDDGISDSLRDGIPATERIEIRDLPNDIYIIKFKEIDNINSDTSIKYIKFNTNKIMLNNDFIITTPTHLFNFDGLEKEIKFYHWNEADNQDINIIVDNKPNKVILNNDNINKWVSTTIKDYENVSIELPKGNVRISTSSNNVYNTFSTDKNLWFATKFRVQKKPENPNFIIIKKSNFLINENSIIYKNSLNKVPKDEDITFTCRTGLSKEIKLRNVYVNLTNGN